MKGQIIIDFTVETLANDFDGMDIDDSVEKFIELCRRAIKKEYNDFEVGVRCSDIDYIYVGKFYNPTDDEENEIKCDVKTIKHDVWASNEWIVDNVH